MNSESVQRSQETAAQVALDSSPISALREITVSEADGQLLLSGRVSTFYYKQLAQEAVRAAVRDAHVVNGILVD